METHKILNNLIETKSILFMFYSRVIYIIHLPSSVFNLSPVRGADELLFNLPLKMLVICNRASLDAKETNYGTQIRPFAIQACRIRCDPFH